MKRIVILLLAALLLFSGCAQAESEAEAMIAASPECGMIGKTYSEVEDAYGPLSTVYIEADGSPLMLFTKTQIGFYFSGMAIPAAWSSYTSSGAVPAAVAVRGIPSDEPCTGVSGRLKDFGVTDLDAMSQAISLLKPVYSAPLDKDIYSLLLPKKELEIDALAESGSGEITKDTVVRIRKSGTEGPTMPPSGGTTPAPAAPATPGIVDVVTPSPTPDYSTPYRTAQSYMASGNYIEALAILQKLNGYADSEELIRECQNEIVYRNAMEQYDSRNYKEAALLFESIQGYKDAEKWKLRAQILPTKKGDKLYFGYFEQDDKTSEPEPIQWIVLARTGNKRLLISRYILVTMPFDKGHKVYDNDENIAESSRVAASWEKSSIRKWLNNTFLNTAFDETERACILKTSNTNEGNTYFNIKGGSKTSDRIWLLSISEATKYFNTASARKTSKTAYAKNMYKAGQRYTWWYLRSPGMHVDFAAIVLSSGNYTEAYGDWQGRGVSNAGGIRPVMWIDLT